MEAIEVRDHSEGLPSFPGHRGSHGCLSSCCGSGCELLFSGHSPVCPRDLLDLGCGKAPLWDLYRSFVGQTVLLDWDNSLHPNRHLDFTQDLNEPLLVESSSFGTVILSDVLEHIREPAALVCEVSRILADGGVLLMNVPFLYGLHEVPHDYYRYTRFSLEHFAKAAGLQVIELESIGGYPEVFGDMLSKASAWIPKVGPTIAGLIQRLTAAFIRTKIGRRISVKTAESSPLGYTMVARKL
jgi:SAM-dependent methyltransferase